MGGQYYPIQTNIVVIGSKSGTTRTSETLESTYDGSTQYTFPTGGYSTIVLDILYTTGATETSNSIELLIEGSPDGVNYYRLSNESASGGTSTLTQREFTFVGASAATAYSVSIRMDIAYKNMRIEAKETGVVTNKGTAYIEATLSGR